MSQSEFLDNFSYFNIFCYIQCLRTNSSVHVIDDARVLMKTLLALYVALHTDAQEDFTVTTLSTSKQWVKSDAKAQYSQQQFPDSCSKLWQ